MEGELSSARIRLKGVGCSRFVADTIVFEMEQFVKVGCAIVWHIFVSSMKIYSCRVCGGRLIFRMCVRMKNGQVINYGKPIPIHLDGSCGQMFLPFA